MEAGDQAVSSISPKSNKMSEKAQITISEFLSFLKAAYQVQDSVEGVLTEGGMQDALVWLKNKELEFSIKDNSISIQTSESLLSRVSSNSSQEILTTKLNEVLSEGLLDSVLPYLLPSAQSIRKSQSSNTIKNSSCSDKSSSISLAATSNLRRKSSGDTNINIAVKPTIQKNDSEVEIHVCDEVQNLKKTFTCNQNLLVEKMGYFAEVTLGQRLEDMDISVHCDIGIFEWLMQWMKAENQPQLDSQCVVPILVSAAFLQMEPLLQDCLLYCHGHMNDILRTSTNLSCLNDSVLTRLAAMYTNTEAEGIRDRKDKIQSRLFCKLIQSLAEPEAETVRGHWCSIAKIFKCEKCQQLIAPSVATRIPCAPSCMRLQSDGSIVSLHTRDINWNINDYIIKLQKSLKTWRKVYWRLWGEAHFLYCTICKRYFPTSRIGWCQYHPDSPQFFTLDAQKAPLPIGRYPCCGERAYRFQLLDNHSACQFRQHTVRLEDVRQSGIYSMLESYRHVIEEEPPELLFPERLTRLVARDSATCSEKFVSKETFWWDGFAVIPPRPRMGLLTAFAHRASKLRTEPSVSDESTTTTTEEVTDDESSSSSGESGEGSAESNPPLKKRDSLRSKRRTETEQLWQHNLSARSNQDIQRAYEEGMLKEISVILGRKTFSGDSGPKKGTRSPTYFGGIWSRLEIEWRDSQQQLKGKCVTTVNRSQIKPRSKF